MGRRRTSTSIGSLTKFLSYELPVANFLRFETIVGNIVANSSDTIKEIFDGSDDVCYQRNDMRNVHFDDGYGCNVCTLKMMEQI